MSNPGRLKSKTLKELRALAKARGLRGYSKLTKDELVARLEANSSSAAAPARTEVRRRPRAKARPSVERERAAAAVDAAPAPGATAGTEPAAVQPPASSYPSTEQTVEEAKYVLHPSGLTVAHARDLDEDIDRLPALTHPRVCLLPQKPGVLYAYWVLPPTGEAERPEYRLRLCRGDTLEVLEEVPVRTERGGWYFHVGEQSFDQGVLVQLGFYRDGVFHDARGRSLARLPSRYAATRVDRRWWVPEADFAQMYLRAGGFMTPARRFGWAASIGSPGAAPMGPEQHLAWPRAVSSRS
ncbi:MAG TPA: Rho termination factor N-terminal domain-containing protein [Burkholderiales bacterium]